MNAIEPAAIATEMLMEGFREAPQKFKELAQLHPIKFIGNTSEVAELALNIASKSHFMHGSCIELNGGISSALLDPDAITLQAHSK